MTPEEKELFALCLWREARGEGIEGMRAVAWVIHNRVRAKWGSYKKVILAKNQFTSMSVSTDSQYKLNPKPEDKAYEAACEIAEQFNDPTGGALYYCNPKYVTSGWFKKNIIDSPKMEKTAAIGRHDFYREI